MPQDFSVSLDRIVRENELELLYCPDKPENIKIYSNDVNRPGLQLGGFYEYFDNTRIQILGKSEFAYVEHKSEEERYALFEAVFPEAAGTGRGARAGAFPRVGTFRRKVRGRCTSQSRQHVGIYGEAHSVP